MPEPDRSTERLIGRCLEGDDDAWAELVGRYRRLVYAVPVRMGLSSEDASDVFQRVWSLVHEHLGRIRDPERLGGWIVTVARRESLVVARRAARDRTEAWPEAPDGAPVDVADARPLHDADVLEMQRARLLHEAIDELPEKCRAIVRELLREDAPGEYTEVARRLGIPRGSLGPTRARCLARLRRILEERGMWK